MLDAKHGARTLGQNAALPLPDHLKIERAIHLNVSLTARTLERCEETQTTNRPPQRLRIICIDVEGSVKQTSKANCEVNGESSKL